ncbi:hypothetical protein HanRHA438_Chr09g0404991 [Helianthus annuus]|nr:hypothetical protein HanRHA438_Chr09g0404991 [Helianthus annuus]
MLHEIKLKEDTWASLTNSLNIKVSNMSVTSHTSTKNTHMPMIL